MECYNCGNKATHLDIDDEPICKDCMNGQIYLGNADFEDFLELEDES